MAPSKYADTRAETQVKLMIEHVMRRRSRAHEIPVNFSSSTLRKFAQRAYDAGGRVIPGLWYYNGFRLRQVTHVRPRGENGNRTDALLD